VLQYVVRSESPSASSSFTSSPRRQAPGSGLHRDDSTELFHPEERVGSITMHATIRRYEAIDGTRISEIVKKVDDSLLPR
jgi:hypothetical protein